MIPRNHACPLRFTVVTPSSYPTAGIRATRRAARTSGRIAGGSGDFMLKEFKDFLSRGNVIDLAVAVVIGAAFGNIVKSLVDDVIMPPIGLLTGPINFSDQFVVLRNGAAAMGPYLSLTAAKEAGAVTVNYGAFLNSIITFLIVAAAVFGIVKAVSRLRPPAPPPAVTTRECPLCFTSIPMRASRCPACTSEVVPVAI